MSFFIICLVILLIAIGVSSSGKKEKIKSYKESTITNLALEKIVYAEKRKYLEGRLNKVDTTVNSIYTYIESLFVELGLPVYIWYDQHKKQEHMEWEKSESDKFERNREEYELRLYKLTAEATQKRKNALKIIANYTEEEKKNAHDIFIASCREYTHYTSAIWSECEKVTPACPPLPSEPPAQLNARNKVLLDRLKNNFKAQNLYNELLQQFVRREMAARGFQMSRDGIHESEWQEAEKAAKQLEEDKKKYPWIYGEMPKSENQFDELPLANGIVRLSEPPAKRKK